MAIVTVITPVYNRERTLERAIRSVLAQSFTDWEMVVIDDGSRDCSPEIARQFAALDPRIKAICLNKNQGANAARNIGVESSNGKWIGLLDSDDEWLPHRLESQLKRIDEWQAEGRGEPGIVYGGIEIHEVGGRSYSRVYDFEGMVYPILLKKFFGWTTTLLIRRDVWTSMRGFSSGTKICDEFEFSLRASQHYPYAAAPGVIAIAYCQPDSKHHPRGHVALMKRHKQDILRHHGRRGLGGIYLDNALRYWAVKEFGAASWWLFRCLLISPKSAKAWNFLLHAPLVALRQKH